jgi:hypothetical protein
MPKRTMPFELTIEYNPAIKPYENYTGLTDNSFLRDLKKSVCRNEDVMSHEGTLFWPVISAVYVWNASGDFDPTQSKIFFLVSFNFNIIF